VHVFSDVRDVHNHRLHGSAALLYRYTSVKTTVFVTLITNKRLAII